MRSPACSRITKRNLFTQFHTTWEEPFSAALYNRESFEMRVPTFILSMSAEVPMTLYLFSGFFSTWSVTHVVLPLPGSPIIMIISHCARSGMRAVPRSRPSSTLAANSKPSARGNHASYKEFKYILVW